MPELIHAEPGSPEWLAARRAGVTATDIVTILGLNTHDSQYSLYWRKLEQVPEPPDNPRWRLGRVLEPYVLTLWGEAHPDLEYDRTGAVTVRSSDRPWQMATPDSVVYHGGEDDLPAIVGTLEVKTWADAAKDHWLDGPPPKVRAQALWQMDTYDVAVGHVGVLFLPSGEFRSYEIHTDAGHPGASDWLADLTLMREYGEEFMARLRHELPPPDPDASAATLAAQRARFARTPDKTAEVSPQTYEAWIGSKAEAKKYAEEAQWLEILLREQLGEATILTVTGQPVARRHVMDQQVKAHTRHMDYLKRIGSKNDE